MCCGTYCGQMQYYKNKCTIAKKMLLITFNNTEKAYSIYRAGEEIVKWLFPALLPSENLHRSKPKCCVSTFTMRYLRSAYISISP